MNEPAAGASGGEPLDVDEAFAAIIADWNRETPAAERSWPAEEDAGPEVTVTRGPAPVADPAPAFPPGAPLADPGPVVEEER